MLMTPHPIGALLFRIQPTHFPVILVPFVLPIIAISSIFPIIPAMVVSVFTVVIPFVAVAVAIPITIVIVISIVILCEYRRYQRRSQYESPEYSSHLYCLRLLLRQA